ncbi:hypothetical protein [Spiroplasma phoeniceum]|uniref:Adhesin P123 n=1 Tax=Spiroplasma phoeniceum P40 TaxID=1276259 RepID=A0A345DRW4_9MOLU|nr:hypothetical protein [Spiroplasma phoeniceum]AXF96955.1 putative adhesin P123 [Spiroplasma phoeniceum P40]
MFSIQALYNGNFEIIFYADNPYTNNEEDYLRLSVWSFRGKTKSVLNNYLRDMTTNYKTSFLLPHDYEITTFNYPQYVLTPVPYNYKPYTKNIMPSDVVLPLKTKITAPAQCKKGSSGNYINLFSDEFNYVYYDVEIDLKQIDPPIQSISKFQDAYKTIEISNLGNLQVECKQPNIENFISNLNVDLTIGNTSCNLISGLLSDLTLQQSGNSQTDKVNFPNTFTIDTKKITNNIQTFKPIAYTNGLPSDNYQNIYKTKNSDNVKFLLQITKLSNNDDNKIIETYLQAYYTNDLKLKIRFTKTLLSQLFLSSNNLLMIYFGNDKDITIDVSNPNVLGIRNKSDSDVKITFKPR